MLPGFLGDMSKFLVINGIDIGEGATDLTEDLVGGNGACPGISILQQWRLPLPTAPSTSSSAPTPPPGSSACSQKTKAPPPERMDLYTYYNII
jgi:hypothetical protein